MLERSDIIDKAIHDCLQEMYAKAQPMADYDNLVEEYRTGKIGKDERVYDRHYLSRKEFQYILNKYIDAYRMNKFWDDNIEVLEEYLQNGGLKDKYIKSTTDENGHYHPGYRSTEKVLPIKEQFLNILSEYNINNSTDIANKLNDILMQTISYCKNFYMFDREADQFGCSIALGASPTSNPDTVKKWWKENYNVDIEIEERNPLLLWEQDYYGDEFEEIMEEEYGPDWKKIWDDRWKKEKEEDEKKFQEKIDKLKN